VPTQGRNRSTFVVDTSIPPEERYQIVGRIAAGGMAEIYLARARTVGGADAEVVLKRLLPELQADHEFVQMFHDEASIASRFRHPNIVHIHELGELDGSLFIAMELLRGVNLRDLLARLHAEGLSLPAPLAARIACSALEALDYAHRFADAGGRKLNVVHRDVSPQNIIVTWDGTVKLVDFGVAKAEGRLHRTRAGLVKGKFAYMSPEQVSGGKLDGRSDLFALAEVFYELLLKRHPFYAESDMEVLRAILDKDPPHPSALNAGFPPPLAEVLMRAMRKAPGDRYATAGQMSEALERFLQDSRATASTSQVGRFVSDLFADRLDAERDAREAGDDAALVDALAAGVPDGAPQRAPAPKHRAQEIAPAPRSGPRSGPRDRALETTGSEPTLAPSGTPALLTAGGPDPSALIQPRLSSEVRELFDDPSERTSPPTSHRAERDEHEIVDDTELPTMLGMLSAHQLAELRHPGGDPEVEVTPGPAPVARAPVSPGALISGGVVVSPVEPGARRELRITPSALPPAVATGRAPTSGAAPLVSARSETVVAAEVRGEAPGSDRVGLLFFLAGLGALVGAVAYAVWLFGSRSPAMTEVVLESTPPGARILLDGADTGRRTPHTVRIADDRPHAVELRLDGHPPCTRQLVPSGKERETLSCTFGP
jgi:serine/threonine protein kinase